jgi:hypothetical protein
MNLKPALIALCLILMTGCGSITSEFVGLWNGYLVRVRWIHFKSNGTYDAGSNDKVTEAGTWEVDPDQQILTFRESDSDKARKFRYNFELDELVLSTIGGRERGRFLKEE